MAFVVVAPSSNPTPVLLRWIGLIALLSYAIFLSRYASVAAGGSDTSGYLSSARLLAAGRLQSELRVPVEFGDPANLTRRHFIPLGFDALPGNPHLAPTYPVGLPLHLAVAGKLAGWKLGPLVVELAAALGALVLCFAIGRELELDPWLAAAAAVMLAAFPVFLFTSIQPLSDTLATTWCAAAFWAGLRARVNVLWALACGAAVGMAVLVRPSNAVLLPALVVLLGWDWRRLALATAGGLPAAAWLAYYNSVLYGSPYTSGYGPIDEAFALRYGSTTFLHFAYWLAVLLPAVVLVLPWLAIRREQLRVWLALFLWFGAFAGLYTFYEVSQNTWWCLRFILPGIPALLIAGLLALNRWKPRLRIGAAFVLMAWAVACALFWVPRLHPLLMKEYEGLYPALCARARAVLPPDALIASSAATGALYHYTGFATLRWDQVTREEFAGYTALLAKSKRPFYAILFEGVEDEALKERIPGPWTKVDAVKNVTFWRWVPSPDNAAP